MLGHILAHLGAYVGVFWTKKKLKKKMDKKRTKNGPKRSRQRPAGCYGTPRAAPEGPKTEPFLAPSKTSLVDVPTCINNASKNNPNWGPSWPILEAPLALCWAMLSKT